MLTYRALRRVLSVLAPEGQHAQAFADLPDVADLDLDEAMSDIELIAIRQSRLREAYRKHYKLDAPPDLSAQVDAGL